MPNYKQVEQFNERKLVLLLLMSQHPKELEDTGTLIRITKFCKILGVSYRTLMRIIHKLEAEEYITCTFKGYCTDKHKSRRYCINDNSIEIINNYNNIIKYLLYYTKYYINCYNQHNTYINIPNVDTFNLDTKKSKIAVNPEQAKLLGVINYVNILINENNQYTSPNAMSLSNLRIEGDQLKGRVFNSLCFARNGKKTYINQDKRWFRNDLFEYYGYAGYEEVFDIKSQIPRLTYILQGGNYDDIQDFYCIADIKRATVKTLALRAYFERSEKQATWRATLAQMQKYNVHWDDKDKMWSFVRKKMKIVWEYFHTVIKPIGAEIFLWTSLWEQLIIKTVREQLGIHLINVYDGFYGNQSAKSKVDDIESIARQTSLEVRQIYLELK